MLIFILLMIVSIHFSSVVQVSTNDENGLENNFEAFIKGEASEWSTSDDETLTEI